MPNALAWPGLGDDRQAHPRGRRRLGGIFAPRHDTLLWSPGPSLSRTGLHQRGSPGEPAPCSRTIHRLIEPLLRERARVFAGRRGISRAAARRPPLLPPRGAARAGFRLGQAQSVVMVARQPVDIDGPRPLIRRLLTRWPWPSTAGFPLARAGHRPDAVVLTPEPIAPGDDAMLRRCWASSSGGCGSCRSA